MTSPRADGNVWFTEPTKGWVARITPAGQVTEFSDGITPHGGLSGITAGPDGNVWFGVLANRAPRIGRITPAGKVTEFSSGLAHGEPQALAAGPDGNVWFTTVDSIARITPAGKITNFSAGLSANSDLVAIAAGPDGNLWFTEFNPGRLGRITPQGKITEFSAGMAHDEFLNGITAGPDASLWFNTSDGVGRLTPTPGTAVSVLSRNARVSTRGSAKVKLACGKGTEPCAGRLVVTVIIRRTQRLGKRRASYPETIVLGTTSFALTPGERATVKLRLNAGGRRRVAQAKHRRLRTRYRAASSAGDAQGRIDLRR